ETLDRDWTCAQDLPQRPALDALHGDVEGRPVRADVEDRDDVGVVESRGGARLLLEALQPPAVIGDLLLQDLERDPAREPRVPRPIDLTHPTRAERREDLVRAQP